MTRRLRIARCGAIVVLVSLLCGLSPRQAARLRFTTLTQDPSARADRGVVLPAGFAVTVDRATRDQLVRVVASDVDRDGDIDVVASLGSLDLIVWKNDGAGHFIRQSASPHRTFQVQPPAPSADGDSPASSEWIQNDQPRGADLESLGARSDKGPESPFFSIVRIATGRYGPRLRLSRAPPIAPSL